MANRWTTQFVNTFHKKLVQLDCNFIVDSTNGNGLGIRSLKGPGIANVFMHTSASFSGTTHTNAIIDGISSTSSLVVGMPLSGAGIAAGTVITSITSGTAITVAPVTTASATVTISYAGVGSPNPASGLILVNFQDNYNRYYFGTSGFVSPLSGTSISISTGSSLTVGNAYTITAVGTTTLAQWIAVGVPPGSYQGGGVTGTTSLPTVGTTFIATATSGSGTGTVQASVLSGISNIEVIGDANQTITSKSPSVLGGGSGAYMILQCANAGGTIAVTGATHTSTTIDGISPGTAGFVVGHTISGTGIPLGATIASIVSATAITISAAATATASGVALTTSGDTVAAPANGSACGLSFFMSNSVIQQQGE